MNPDNASWFNPFNISELTTGFLDKLLILIHH